MNLKNLTLATALVLAIPGLSLVACKKTPNKVTVKITADDANTARTWEGDSLNKTGQSSTPLATWGFDSLVSKEKDNANDAEVIEAKISYTDQKGKPVTKELGKDFQLASLASGVEVADAKIGAEITVTAKAKSKSATFIADTTGKFSDLKNKEANEVAKAIQEALKKAGIQDDVNTLNDKAATVPTVTLVIDVNGTKREFKGQPATGFASSAKVEVAK